MSKRKKLLQEESKLLRSYFVNLLADLIKLHYKFYKNEKFDTFEQYLNGYKSLYLVESKEDRVTIYHEVDDVIMSKYKIFFAHYELEEPIHLVSVAGKELEE